MNQDAVYEGKAQFVQFQLSPMVAAATGGDVDHLDYVRDGTRERVHVVFANEFTRIINVTGDNLVALARDVLKFL